MHNQPAWEQKDLEKLSTERLWETAGGLKRRYERAVETEGWARSTDEGYDAYEGRQRGTDQRGQRRALLGAGIGSVLLSGAVQTIDDDGPAAWASWLTGLGLVVTSSIKAAVAHRRGQQWDTAATQTAKELASRRGPEEPTDTSNAKAAWKDYALAAQVIAQRSGYSLPASPSDTGIAQMFAAVEPPPTLSYSRSYLTQDR